ncbi:MAG TPA: NAD(P)/FAD-dependent oxidoreductase, partial [Pirellulales bacterium]|nr:NAD(P)/FAD-dependent oxidoreductase [Pirellulales bacterium]
MSEAGPHVTTDVPVQSARTRVAIVGAGFSGLGIAMALKREGTDFAVFERSDRLGGTWRDNSYPGSKCDVPSHLYSFSFAPNPEWRHTYSTQAEIWAYLEGLAERFELLPHVRFEHELRSASWDEAARGWRLATSRGPWLADVLISACGALSEPSIPAIEGLGTFQGRSFHSARWDHAHDLAGERIAVIGAGASAVQFVPQIQPRAKRLYLFQRTPPWVFPHPDREITDAERALYRRVPAAQRIVRAGVYWSRELVALALTKRPRLTALLERMARKHLARQIQDPELRRKLTPDYAPGCKRMLISNDYYPSLAAPNVEVVAETVREVRARSIVTVDGREREIDTLIFGTGFRVTDNPVARRVRGAGGASLARAWAESGSRAYLGTTVPGFPNLFLMTGPNTGIGHTSLLLMIEAQIPYLIGCLRLMQARGLTRFEVRRGPCDAFNEELQRKMRRTVWNLGGCTSWYLDRHGRNTTLWPDFTWKYRWRMRRFDPENYDFA